MTLILSAHAETMVNVWIGYTVDDVCKKKC